MDADRILQLENKKLPIENPDVRIRDYSKKLIHYAETLYELAGRDDAWEQLTEPGG